MASSEVRRQRAGAICRLSLLVLVTCVSILTFSTLCDARVTAMRITSLRPGTNGEEAFADNDWDSIWPSGCFRTDDNGVNDWTKCACSCVRTTSGDDVQMAGFCHARMEPKCGSNSTNPGHWCSMTVDVEAELDTSPSTTPRLVESAHPIYFVRLLDGPKTVKSSSPYKVKWTYQVGVTSGLWSSYEGEMLVTFAAYQGTQTPGVSISTSVNCVPLDPAEQKVTVTGITADCKTGDIEVTMNTQGCPSLFNMHDSWMNHIELFDGAVGAGVKYLDWQQHSGYSLYSLGAFEHNENKQLRIVKSAGPGVVKAIIKRGNGVWPSHVKSIRAGIRFPVSPRGYSWDSDPEETPWVPPEVPEPPFATGFAISSASVSYKSSCGGGGRRLLREARLPAEEAEPVIAAEETEPDQLPAEEDEPVFAAEEIEPDQLPADEAEPVVAAEEVPTAQPDEESLGTEPVPAEEQPRRKLPLEDYTEETFRRHLRATHRLQS